MGLASENPRVVESRMAGAGSGIAGLLRIRRCEPSARLGARGPYLSVLESDERPSEMTTVPRRSPASAESVMMFLLVRARVANFGSLAQVGGRRVGCIRLCEPPSGADLSVVAAVLEPYV